MNARDLKTGLIVFLLSIVIPDSIFAIERGWPPGAREAALSLAVVALPGSCAASHNQALLSETKYPSATIGYRQPYLIQNYHDSSISLVMPIPYIVFATVLSQSSLAGYKESNLGIALAKKLSKKVSAGLLINYLDFNLPEVGKHKGSLQVDGGLSFNYSERLILGLHLRNMTQSRLETFQYKLTFPLVIRTGFSFRLTQQILLAGESTFDTEGGLGIRCGVEYLILSNFLLRGGIASNSFQHSFGFGYIWRFCQLDFAMVHHALLGFSPFFSVNFNLRR